jgi:ABC-type nitrate/sulfonate/bicarbonate transport system substrate-binding protein
MKENLKLLIAVIIIVIFSGIFLLTKSEDNNENLATLNVGITDTKRAEWLFNFADNRGFFEDSGLKINTIETGANTIALLSSGEVDLTTQMIASSLTPFLNDENIKLIAVTQYSSDNYGVSRYPEESISQVKRVGVPRIGGAFHISIIPVLQTLGVDLSKVEYVTMGVPISSRIALLERGEIDFTLIDQEDIGPLDESKFYLIPSEKIYKNSFAPRGVLTTQATIDKKSKEIQIYVNVMAKALNYIQNNKAEVVDYFSENLEISKDEAEAYYEEIRDVKVDKGFVPEAYILESLVGATIDLAKPKNPTRDISEFIDTSFAEKAKNKY